MFAPKAGSTTSLRNPRRRQRTSSGESIKAPSAKRQRPILNQDDKPNTGDLTDGAPNHRSSIPTATTEVGSATAPDGENQRDIPIRTFNKAEKRKSDVISPIILYPNCHVYLIKSEISVQAYRDTSDVLPLGLMILMPHNGRIIYWETVSCSASLSLPRQKQAGLQGYVPGMLSGEYATDIVNGEPSGVIVTFSTGRVAHITLRDSQGKPAVTVNFLKNPHSTGGIGFLDGIKNVLGAGYWRKKVAAVRAGESFQRGQRDIIIATSAGLVEIWDTHWNNGSILKKKYEIKEDLLAAARKDEDFDYEVKIWDLAVVSDSHEDNSNSWEISVLVGLFSGSNIQGVFVTRLRLSDGARILSATPISLHFFPADSLHLEPRLFVPRPHETAFIVIGQSIILLSLTDAEATSSSQLLIDNDQPRTFHDSINFRSGQAYEVLGSGFEDQNEGCANPSCLLMIREFGVVRITALPRQETAETARISAQHKLEQAVFYGTMLGNPLNLSSKGDLDFPVKEIEEATLAICQGLLRSTSKFIPSGAISIDQNLKLRSKALDDLSRILLDQNKILDRRIWWELLWGAEKLAAQKAIWRLEASARKRNSSGPTFLAHVLGLMNEKFKTKLDDTNDPVRQWFLFDTYRMEHIVPWIFHAIKPQKGTTSKQMRRMSEQILEASELSLAVLETAFRYRDEHASQFGIGDGYLEEGVLTTNYEGLPEFWTSQSIGYSETGHLLDLELDSCRAIQQTSTSSDGPDQITAKIARNSARHLRIMGQMYSERIRWLSAQEDQKLIDEASAIKQSHIKQRRWQLFKLAGIGQLNEAIDLAEGFHDMSALVELIIELQDQNKVMFTNVDTPHGIELDRKISLYFEKFGDAWADAFFGRQISMGQPGILFSAKKFQSFVTRFLHKHQPYARLSWINDVIGEADYECAAKTLEHLALEQEQDVWGHRVKLALAKLSHLARWEKDEPSDTRALQNDIKRLEGLAEMGAVQEVIYSYISPVLRDAIDQKAEIDLAIDHFAQSTTQNLPSLHELLKEALAGVVTRKMLSLDQLVDVLTLINPGQDPDFGQNEFSGDEFHLALRVIRLGLNAQGDPNYSLALQKLVWRRCIIRDNWDATSGTAEQIGSETESPFTATALSRTLILCLNDRTDPSNPPLYRPNCPQDVLLNDTDSALISSRFRPEQRARITRDLERENSTLLRYIEKGELECWFKSLLSSAEKERMSNSALQTTCSTDAESSLSQTNRKERLSWL
ncbi:Non-repetitive/WGA-negative nucleoporin C-terminal-domain-containing protein [Aspergillus spinulosporus]